MATNRGLVEGEIMKYWLPVGWDRYPKEIEYCSLERWVTRFVDMEMKRMHELRPPLVGGGP